MSVNMSAKKGEATANIALKTKNCTPSDVTKVTSAFVLLNGVLATLRACEVESSDESDSCMVLQGVHEFNTWSA